MTKKILSILIVLLCFFAVTSVEANSESNFLDMQTYNNIYKLSEESDVKLPFVKFFAENAFFDKRLEKSGLSIGAKEVKITEDVNGLQAIISGDTVAIEGNMEYAVIVASNVNISGNIEKDVFILAESIFVTETANISGDIIAMAGKIEHRGNVDGNFIANSTDFLMEGKVGKDFRVCSQSITFNETDIKGDIYIETESDFNISDKYENAVVKKIQTNVVTEAERKNQIINTIIGIITAVILFTLFNLLVKKIKPQVFVNLANKIKAHSSYAVIAGVIGLTSIPLVAMLAFICSLFGFGVVTTPLFVVYVAILVVAIALAKFITGSVIFEIIKEKIKIENKFKEMAILAGIFTLIYVLCYIPYIAWFMTVATVLVSTGIIVTGLTKK